MILRPFRDPVTKQLDGQYLACWIFAVLAVGVPLIAMLCR